MHAGGMCSVVWAALPPPTFRPVPSLPFGLLRSHDLRRSESPPFLGGFEEAVATAAGAAAGDGEGVGESLLATGRAATYGDDGGEIVGWPRRSESASLCPFLHVERSDGGVFASQEDISVSGYGWSVGYLLVPKPRSFARSCHRGVGGKDNKLRATRSRTSMVPKLQRPTLPPRWEKFANPDSRNPKPDGCFTLLPDPSPFLLTNIARTGLLQLPATPP